jgi:hypothetical protein
LGNSKIKIATFFVFSGHVSKAVSRFNERWKYFNHLPLRGLLFLKEENN